METKQITLNDFYSRLQQRCSNFNAKMLLASAVHSSGWSGGNDEPLQRDIAEAICMELIKKGGPSFQVGKEVYSTLQ